ncbi:MAG: lytic transglycosylase domain-containing protein [Mesorhizobium sp.]|nr:MAG: lytic transglycosylase domain-containing protein [Mesorhizobium sp.]TJV55135.1 MAG: lytic transglycosylase domain-containing protein [Mesorhizobium sp.]
MARVSFVGILAAGVALATQGHAQDAAPRHALQPVNVAARMAAAFRNEKPAAYTVTLNQSPEMQSPAATECPAVDSNAVSDLVRSVAAEEGVDADLADAVAWVESRHGAARKESSAGAVGIMQLMPGTAGDLGVRDRCDVEANVRGGIRYLKQLYGEFGDPLLMLAAYNAGPANVRQSRGIPELPETAGYIIKVLNRWKLSAMVGSSQPANVSEVKGEGKLENAWKDGHVIEVE